MQLKEWWGKYPYASIAVVTGPVSKILVADDDEKGGSSERFQTLCSCTGSGGHHFFFRLNGESYASRNRISNHLDIKCDGGYVILPPSTHISGFRYHWNNSLPLSAVPAEVKTLLNGIRPALQKEGGHTEGTRNNAMMREVCSLFGKGLNPYEVFEKIKEWNQEWNYPPLSEKELKACVASIWNNKEKPRRMERTGSRREHPTGALQIRSSEYMFQHYGAREQGWLVPHWLPSATVCITIPAFTLAQVNTD